MHLIPSANGSVRIRGGVETKKPAFLVGLLGSIIIPQVIETAAAQPPSPPPPPVGHASMLLLLILACALALFLIWKMKTRGAKLGAIWGLGGPILYWLLAESNLPGVRTALQIIALPMFIYSKIFIPEAAPGGSFYHSPIIVFPFSIVLGTLIGCALEKVYREIKRERPQMGE